MHVIRVFRTDVGRSRQAWIAGTSGHTHRGTLVYSRVVELCTGVIKDGKGYRVVKLGAPTVAIAVHAKLDSVVVAAVAGIGDFSPHQVSSLCTSR